MAAMPRRNGPAPRSFAAEAHGCFMVRIRGVDSTECKVAARSFAPDGGHPSVRSRSAHAPRPGLASGRRRLTIAGRSTTATGQTPAILARQKDDGHRQKRLEKKFPCKAQDIWDYLRSNFLSHRVWDSYEAILDACCDAWNALIAKPEVIASIATRDWAQVKT